MSFWDIWNMSFGFLGIQFGFALQNGNASRILLTFGADLEKLSWFWIVAPLTGLIVQPIIGHYSDKTWTRLGRRKPYFLSGAVLASIALLLMPNAAMFTAFAPALLIGAGMMMIMDASFNVAMEPFRALVADLLPADQRTLGFSVQTVIIGIGAVIGSWLPYMLAEWLGISKTAPEGHVPNNVIFSFYIGAAVLIGCVLRTIFTTKEYPPEVYANEEDDHNRESKENLLVAILRDFKEMPKTMKQLGLVQFFSWFALFAMWVFMTPAVAVHVYGADIHDSTSETFNNAANWVGFIFGIYNGVAAIYAFALPAIAKRIGRKKTHALSLVVGGISLISIYFISNPHLLLLPMLGIGMAWGSILAMPYAILAGSLPAKKMGVYMGIFNFFITLPQILNAIIGGPMVKRIFNDQAIYAIVMAGVLLFVSAAAVLFVEDKE